MKSKTYYLHTIDGRPAYYVPGMQICYINFYGKPKPLVASLDQIRAEQKASSEWRKAQGYDHGTKDYGYRRVRLP